MVASREGGLFGGDMVLSAGDDRVLSFDSVGGIIRRGQVDG